jgi:chromosome segregation ATPase
MKSQQQQLQNIEGKSKSQQKVYEVPKETYSLLQQENQQLKEHLESSENTRKNLEKTLKAEADIYKNKLRTAEKTINDLREELTRKERDFSILIMKMKQTGSLEEEKDRKDENLQTWTPPSLDCRRELKGLTLLRPGAKKFDDSDALPSGSDYRISKLTFRYF